MSAALTRQVTFTPAEVNACGEVGDASPACAGAIRPMFHEFSAAFRVLIAA